MYIDIMRTYTYVPLVVAETGSSSFNSRLISFTERKKKKSPYILYVFVRITIVIINIKKK